MYLRSTVVKKKKMGVHLQMGVTPERLEIFFETLTMLTKIF